MLMEEIKKRSETTLESNPPAGVSIIGNRLRELIRLADNSKGLTGRQIEAISEEGSQIIEQLPPETVLSIFKNI